MRPFVIETSKRSLVVRKVGYSPIFRYYVKPFKACPYSYDAAKYYRYQANGVI